MKHTSGPWVCHRTSRYYFDYRITGPDKQFEFDYDENCANAYLIEAAPDMHKALKLNLQWLQAALECPTWNWDGDQRTAAEESYEIGMAALRKAEGY